MYINPDKCVACGNCTYVCPMGAIYVDPKINRATVDRNECVECYACFNGLSQEHLNPTMVRTMRKIFQTMRLRFDPEPDVCPTACFEPDELAWPRVVRRVFVGAGAHHLSVSPSGNQMWVALGERARTIVVLDVSDPWRPKVVGRFDPGFAAHDLAFSSDWRVWVTASDRRSVTIFDSRTLRPVARVAAGAPPQHVAFGPIREAFVTSGYGSSLEIVDRSSGRIRRTVHVPYGSFNVATFGSFVVTSSLLRGTLTELTENGRVWMNRRVAPAARGVAVATF